jgi:Uncharacterized protein conserved in bacteria
MQALTLPRTRIRTNCQRAAAFLIWRIATGSSRTEALSRRVDFRRAPGHTRLQRHCALDFLRETDFDTLYIVGDLIDIWSLRRAIYWPQQHNDVIQKILRKARKGTRVVYVPGNHDELVTSFCGAYGNIEIKENANPCDWLRPADLDYSRSRARRGSVRQRPDEVARRRR